MTASKPKLAVAEEDKSEYNKGITTIDKKTLVRLTRGYRKDKIRLNQPILIAGFPGPGLVGSMSTNYIIEKLSMDQIACIESQFIVPGVIYVGGRLRHPFRLYTNKQADVCVLVCEAPIMIQGLQSVLNTVMKWSVNNNMKEVFVLEGIPVQGIPGSDRKPIVLSSDNIEDGRRQKTASYNRSIYEKPFETNAFIGGISGGLLSSCLSNEIPCTALLIAASSGIPDPEGAAILIETISRITNNSNLNVETRDLKEQGAELKKHMQELIKSVHEQQILQQQQQQGSVSEHQIMYG
jgi:uncharacterized protein